MVYIFISYIKPTITTYLPMGVRQPTSGCSCGELRVEVEGVVCLADGWSKGRCNFFPVELVEVNFAEETMLFEAIDALSACQQKPNKQRILKQNTN